MVIEYSEIWKLHVKMICELGQIQGGPLEKYRA